MDETQTIQTKNTINEIVHCKQCLKKFINVWNTGFCYLCDRSRFGGKTTEAVRLIQSIHDKDFLGPLVVVCPSFHTQNDFRRLDPFINQTTIDESSKNDLDENK